MSMISWWESDKSCCLEYGKWSLGFNTYLSPIIFTKFLTENDYIIKSFAPLTVNSRKKEDLRHHVEKSYTWTWLELGDEGYNDEFDEWNWANSDVWVPKNRVSKRGIDKGRFNWKVNLKPNAFQMQQQVSKSNSH